jgi:hypothetical protein
MEQQTSTVAATCQETRHAADLAEAQTGQRRRHLAPMATARISNETLRGLPSSLTSDSC